MTHFNSLRSPHRRWRVSTASVDRLRVLALLARLYEYRSHLYKPAVNGWQIASHSSTPSSTVHPPQHVEADYHRCHWNRYFRSFFNTGVSKSMTDTELALRSRVCRVPRRPRRPIRLLHHSSPPSRDPFVGGSSLERQRKVQDDHREGFHPISRGRRFSDRRPRRLRLGTWEECQGPLRRRVHEDPRRFSPCGRRGSQESGCWKRGETVQLRVRQRGGR